MNHFSKYIHWHLLRQFSSLPKLPNFTRIPSKYRPQAIKDAQQALTDYLHYTRYIPFVYAEHIAKNSLFSLSSLTCGIDFSTTSLYKKVPRFLSYHPINEYEFFECIAIDYSELYKEEALIFRVSSKDLKVRLCRIEECGFSNVSVIGICLAFTYVLRGVGELDGCEKGKIGYLMGRNKSLFLQHPEVVLVRKIEYFCRFSVRKEDVSLLILQSPEILDFDLETPVISVMRILKHFALSAENRDAIAKEYPYALGRNKMANLPNVMRALNLHEWFFDRIKDGNHRLLADCTLGDVYEDFYKDFRDRFERIQLEEPLSTQWRN
ncbi:RNA-binding KH domain-containing protein isoform 1 [Hibiscus syriacus]|uniref:RNA-binding KH domain-containing protein isoform 1 n=1 Tax=Hibiscus syriacus TaxID=106335 RepID=A0A6A3BVN3_HIBSY|nr:RNA-binding KH domain-containing protein isoform 1 [Hibiscus syriacus]